MSGWMIALAVFSGFCLGIISMSLMFIAGRE